MPKEMIMKKYQFSTTKAICCTLTLAGMMAISANTARAQKPENDSRETPAAITQAQDVDQLEKRIQKLELLDRQRRSDEAREKRAQQLEGSWDVNVTPVVPPSVPQPASFRAHTTFSRGGAMFGSDRNRPFSKQHGNWDHIGGDEFVYTITEDLYNATATFSGTLKVRVKLTVLGPDEFIGVSNAEERDVDGNLVNNRCATIKGLRIAIEALSPQCLNIVPPR
jgi:hypothetical protein